MSSAATVIEMTLRDRPEYGASGEILAEQPVGVLVAARPHGSHQLNWGFDDPGERARFYNGHLTEWGQTEPS